MADKTAPAAELAARFINQTGRHIFLTGRAGTGKTTFLRNIVSQTHKKAIVAAPTGIAAINAGGVTLHSLFQLPFGAFIPSGRLPEGESIPTQINTPETLSRDLQMHRVKRALLRELELLIIDEVSMLRADLLDAIDLTLRLVRRNRHIPFGGVQILFIGDLYQLPPVVKQDEWQYLGAHYPDIHFFNALALRDRPPVYIELDRIYRQSDDGFITLLNHFRENRVGPADIRTLNERYMPDFQPDAADGYIRLTTHNRKADQVNREALAKLPGESVLFSADIKGDFNESQYPVEPVLELKEGAQVMFIKNDYSGAQRYFNGKIGMVGSLDEDSIGVSFDGGETEIEVERYVWQNKRYLLDRETNEIREEITGTFTHYPLRLAWAITVHKSQGLTFEKAVIDVSEAFAPGQVYVALSRLVSLDGLVLSSPMRGFGPGPDASLARYILDRDTDPDPEALLPEETRIHAGETVLKAFDLENLVRSFRKFRDSHDLEDNRTARLKFREKAGELCEVAAPLQQTASKFSGQLRAIMRRPDWLPLLKERLESAVAYFEPLFNGISTGISALSDRVQSEKKAKAYLDEIRELERLVLSQWQLIRKSLRLADSLLNGIPFSNEVVSLESPFRKKEQKSVRAATREKTGKKEREPSARVTLELLRQGKTAPEIARERSVTLLTVENHLAECVAKGWIPIEQLVDPQKIGMVEALTETLQTNRLKPYKEALGDDVTWAEIKYVLAYLTYR